MNDLEKRRTLFQYLTENPTIYNLPNHLTSCTVAFLSPTIWFQVQSQWVSTWLWLFSYRQGTIKFLWVNSVDTNLRKRVIYPSLYMFVFLCLYLSAHIYFPLDSCLLASTSLSICAKVIDKLNTEFTNNGSCGRFGWLKVVPLHGHIKVTVTCKRMKENKLIEINIRRTVFNRFIHQALID